MDPVKNFQREKKNLQKFFERKGKLGIIGIKTTINQSVFGVFSISFISAEFFHIYIKSIRAKWMKHAMGMRKAPKINGIIIKRMPFPLPPLAEQYHIVAKVNALMTLCDALEARLKELTVVGEVCSGGGKAGGGGKG